MCKDDLWKWRLRFLASVDIVGSTAFKGRSRRLDSGNEIPDWHLEIHGFFRDFPDTLKRQYIELDHEDPKREKFCEIRETDRTQIWKFVGDEILFHATLHSYQQSLVHVVALRNALIEYSKDFQSKTGLSLKATAWLAGFPVTNCVLKQPIPGNGTIPDFIGPQVDLGFRLARFASPRRMPVSVDLALMLLDAMHNIHDDPCRIALAPKEQLKGVLDDNPYPIVWVDAMDQKQTSEEELLGVAHVYDQAKLASYLNKFITSTNKIRKSFIENDSDPRYGKLPSDLSQQRDELKKMYDDIRSESQISPDTGPDTEGPRNEPDAPMLPQQ